MELVLQTQKPLIAFDPGGGSSVAAVPGTGEALWGP